MSQLIQVGGGVNFSVSRLDNVEDAVVAKCDLGCQAGYVIVCVEHILSIYFEVRVICICIFGRRRLLKRRQCGASNVHSSRL